MPHQVIEYSKNLEADLDIEDLVRTLHETAAAIDALPVGGIRTRAVRRDHYRIADGHADNAFINVTLRIAEGRTAEEKRGAGERLFSALLRYVDTVYGSRPLALSFEIQEIDPECRWKQSNIRDYMARRAN